MYQPVMKIASKMEERRNVGKFKKVVSYQKEKKNVVQILYLTK